MTELVPSSEMRLLMYSGNPITLLQCSPMLEWGSFCYELQIDVKAFPVHDARIQWNNKG